MAYVRRKSCMYDISLRSSVMMSPRLMNANDARSTLAPPDHASAATTRPSSASGMRRMRLMGGRLSPGAGRRASRRGRGRRAAGIGGHLADDGRLWNGLELVDALDDPVQRRDLGLDLLRRGGQREGRDLLALRLKGRIGL